MKIFIVSKDRFQGYSNNLKNYLEKRLRKDVEIFLFEDELAYLKKVTEISRKIVEKNGEDRLITIDESGGLGFAASAKVKKMIVAQCADEHSAHMTREHNNAMGIALGANITSIYLAKEIARLFLETKFAAGRHMIRIDMLNKLA
ncbi:RpiB/LacA/LacB family sugar-phosphate isomerase [Candidatus Hepatoplasma crinochetorum]|uniref:Galactose-6-phosphate isomerase subunit lacA n=1 Tax=Candidatus Hepatoplasma crinochetorum Av TaxID=1427984 RepID=W8GNN0_9MOLU|nr:RpiB/LacA/LacB family sugar-phosphate isomerase [Candidatus Hepatoplasma crinochetorum]AHK22636.1 Galactose-6-phosphate isomerase subunit lacA [Candidatus Hepatoplasma crinochetorum Av]BDV03217.1 MAG: galactose-6-phosphate isomerase subunit LacA [Candidatus Hepatoplasma crinochetorum]